MLFISFRNHTVRNWNVKNCSNPSSKPYSNKQKTINANTTIIQNIHSVMKYLCHKWPRICSTCRKHFPDHSSFITATNPSEAPAHTPVFSGVRVTRSLVLWVCFVDCCLILLSFSFGHCVVCSSIYVFWLPFWYLQSLLRKTTLIVE